MLHILEPRGPQKSLPKVKQNASKQLQGQGMDMLTAATRQKMEALPELSCRSPSEMNSNGQGKLFFLLLKQDLFLSPSHLTCTVE